MQVDAGLLLEFASEKLDDPQVEIFASEESIAIGRQHFELVLAVHVGDLDDGYVERAAAEIVDSDLGVAALLVHAIRERGRGGFIDDALDVESRYASRVFRRLALGVVEVGGNGDDRFGDVLAQVLLGGLPHLLQHFRRDLGRRELFALRFDPGVVTRCPDDLVGHHAHVALHDLVAEVPADQSLDREQGVVRVGHGLALGALADENLAAVGVCDDRRGRPIPFRILYDPRVLSVQDGDARVRRAEVDSDDFCHAKSSLLRRTRRCVTCRDYSILALNGPFQPFFASRFATSTMAARNRRSFST